MLRTLTPTILATIPAMDDTNPGRDGWTIADEVASLADAGSNGLAGVMIGHGFSPAKPVSVARNIPGISLATLASGLLAGLDSRKAKDGSVRKVTLANDKDGKAVSVDVDAIRDVLSNLDPHANIPGTYIPAGGDGRRRTVAYFLAAVWAAALGREVGPMATVEAGTDKASDALAGNLLDSYRAALGPWQKVCATVHLMRERPSLSESEVQSITGAKRGDAQLMHRAASAIIRHRLTIDPAGRCPGKEEWPAIRDAATAEEAAALLVKVVNSVRPKAIGVDKWQDALALLPEDAVIPPRKLAEAMKAGTEEALAALLSPYMGK